MDELRSIGDGRRCVRCEGALQIGFLEDERERGSIAIRVERVGGVELDGERRPATRRRGDGDRDRRLIRRGRRLAGWQQEPMQLAVEEAGADDVAILVDRRGRGEQPVRFGGSKEFRSVICPFSQTYAWETVGSLALVTTVDNQELPTTWL